MSIEKIVNNPMVKNLFLKQFKDIVKKEGIKYILISVNEDEDFQLTKYNEDIKILSLKEYTDIINALKSNL